MPKQSKKQGFVSLVGGGPGDPGLLTLKGKLRLERADVVIYDALINPSLLEHCRPGVEKIFVGKRRDRHAAEQQEIHRLLLSHARKGRYVCRLKGGDPFLFGRGGEEVEFLKKHRIRFEVVSGVSSIQSVPAAAGIPLTHRELASFVTIATGHEPQLDRAWAAYAPKKTLVILMGLSRISALSRGLVEMGWPARTPIALICSGTLPEQFTLRGRLGDIARKASRAKGRTSSPGMIVVGDVAALSDR